MLATLDSNIAIQCSPLPEKDAVTRGDCIESKKPRATKTDYVPWPYDRTCNACPPPLLAKSQIVFDPSKINSVGNPFLCDPRNSSSTITEYMVRNVVHELAHNCVGGHDEFMESGESEYGRFDPGTIAADFIINCFR